MVCASPSCDSFGVLKVVDVDQNGDHGTYCRYHAERLKEELERDVDELEGMGR